MKRMFVERVRNITSIKPSIANFFLKELALDASSAVDKDLQQRLRLIFMGETGLTADLRHLNEGRRGDAFDVFFTKLEDVVEEYTAADERRHNIAHMSEILSLNDLIRQTKERCPEGTNIPSAALVRLQFTPRNPYSHAALSFTSKIKVQYKVQRRQLRITHKDDHYCNALFKYLRNMAVTLNADCHLFCCDDKAKIPIGAPDVEISTGVRGKKSLAPTTTTLAAADHDLHSSGSLTPSVSLRCAIPEDVNKSFYQGTVTTTINDSVLQSSSPMRHATSLVKQIKDLTTDRRPGVLLLYTDGGTDHRNTLESVKCAAICVFKELDLDLYVAARCSPGNSWINPCERVMSILNIGLQNCTLSRSKGSAELEQALKNCNSLKTIRSVVKADPIVEAGWIASVEPVQQVVENRFRRLSLKGEPVQVMAPVRHDEIDLLTRHLNLLFPDLDVSKLVKIHTSKNQIYQTWLEKHTRQRQYSFQIKKCDDPECCNPPKTNHHWLPDPMLDATGEHYKSFQEVYGMHTTECDRPTFQKPPVVDVPLAGKKKPRASSSASNVALDEILPDDPQLFSDTSLYTAQHARLTVVCVECCKPRIVYSKQRLNRRQELQLALLISDFEYTCGSPLTPPDNQLHGSLLVRLSLDCSSTIETPYYSASVGRHDICYFCGATDALVDANLKEKFKTVLPVCKNCTDKGHAHPCFRPYGKNVKK